MFKKILPLIIALTLISQGAESADKKKGFSISLGQEDTKEVIVRVNGKKFVNIGSMSVGKWVHFAVTTINGTSPTRAFLFTYNGVTKWADGSLSDNSSNTIQDTIIDNHDDSIWCTHHQQQLFL